MSTIQPEGESLRKAVQWIAEEEQAGTTKSRQQLMDEACVTFNLNPKEAEYLARSYQEIAG